MNGDNVLGNMINAFGSVQERICNAMNSVMAEMVNYAKENGPWTDRTGNLRNSLSYKAAELLPDGRIRGIVFAGMEYAIYVEYREGYWVLSGAVEAFRDKLTNLIRERAGL